MDIRTDETGIEWVTITNSSVGGEAEVTKAAFEDVWQDKGWTLKEKAAPAPAAPAAEADAVTRQPKTPPA